MAMNETLIRVPAVTVTHTWQGYVVSDPYMGPQLAIAICDTLEQAIAEAEAWASDTGMTVDIRAR